MNYSVCPNRPEAVEAGETEKLKLKQRSCPPAHDLELLGPVGLMCGGSGAENSSQTVCTLFSGWLPTFSET